jgi:hypothetical protein
MKFIAAIPLGASTAQTPVEVNLRLSVAHCKNEFSIPHHTRVMPSQAIEPGRRRSLTSCLMFSICSIMRHARPGTRTLSDIREPTITIVCAPCGWRGRCAVSRLVEKHGDARLTDLLQTLTDCRKARSASIHDRCKAVYEGLTARERR